MIENKTQVLPLKKVADNESQQPDESASGNKNARTGNEPLKKISEIEKEKEAETASGVKYKPEREPVDDMLEDDAFFGFDTLAEIEGECGFEDDVASSANTAPMAPVETSEEVFSETITLDDGQIPPVRPAFVDYADKRMDSVFASKNKWVMIGIIAVASIVVGAIAVTTYNLVTYVPEHKEPTVMTFDDTNTFVLDSDTYEDITSLTTTVNIERVSSVVAPKKGVVSEVKVKEGDVVKKGDVLFVLTDDDLSKDLEKAEKLRDEALAERDDARSVVDKEATALGAAQDAVDAAQQTLDTVKRVAEEEHRTETTTEPEKEEESTGMNMGASTAAPEPIVQTITIETVPDSVIQSAQQSVSYAETALEQARQAYDKADVQLKAEQAVLDEAQSEVDKIQAQIDALTIKAVADGTVTLVDIKSGQVAPDGFKDAKDVIEISNTSAATVDVNLTGKDAEGFDKTDEVRVYLNDKQVKAEISDIGSDGDTTSAKIALSDFPEDVRDGDECKVEVVKNVMNNTFVVPDSALKHKGDGSASVSLVHDETTSELVSVTIVGRIDDDHYAIKSMLLKEGARLRSDLS